MDSATNPNPATREQKNGLKKKFIPIRNTKRNTLTPKHLTDFI